MITRSKNSESDLADDGLIGGWLLEAISSPWKVPEGHFIANLQTYQFTSVECNLLQYVMQSWANAEETHRKRTADLLFTFCPPSLPFDVQNWLIPGTECSGRLVNLAKLKTLSLHGKVRSKSGLLRKGGLVSFTVELEYVCAQSYIRKL